MGPPCPPKIVHTLFLMLDSVTAMGVMKACLAREWILVKRNSFVYVFKAVQV